MSSIQNHAHTSPTRQLTQRFSTLASFELDESGTNNYARLLQYNACYEAMPTNSKLVVLDVGLSLKKAFNGLIYQNTRHVLLSDQKSNSSIVGVLSVTDFIRVLLHMYKYGCSNEVKRESGEVTKKDSGPPCTSGLAFEDISMFTIEQYQNLVGRKEDLPSLVHVHAEDSLLKAVRLLSAHKIHRLPVLDSKTGSPLFILTHKRLLKFMWLYGQSLSIPDYRLKSCKDLGIGTWDGVRVVHPDTLVLECLDILITKSVSGLPVVERNTFKVVDMYSRFDAIGIALEDRINNLRNVTVSEALEFRNTFRKKGDRVLSIMADDSLWKALTVFVERNVHRLTAVDCDGAVKGLISLSDVLNYMIIMPGAPLPNESPRKRKSFMRSPKNNLSEHLADLVWNNVTDKKRLGVFAYSYTLLVGEILLNEGLQQSGKTTVSNYLADSSQICPHEYRPTQGVRILEFESNDLELNGEPISAEVELWDCSGDRQFENCWPAILRDSHGALIVYRMDEDHSDSLALWYNELVDRCGHIPNNVIILLHDMDRNADKNRNAQFELPMPMKDLKVIPWNIDRDGENLRLEFNSFLCQVIANTKL